VSWSLDLRRRFWDKKPEEMDQTMKEKLMLDLFRSRLSAEKRRRLEQMYAVTNSSVFDPRIKVQEVDSAIGEFAMDMEPKDDPWALEWLDAWETRYGKLWMRNVIAMEMMEEEYRLTKTGRLLVPLMKERTKLRYIAEARMIPKGKLTLFAAFGKFEHVPEHWAILQGAFAPQYVNPQGGGKPV
jgi:hypothetical protein